MQIGDVQIKNPYVLAPMASVTDVAYRTLCRRYGAGLVFSDMISANGFAQNNRRTLEKFIVSPEEHPVALQIFGSRLDNLIKCGIYASQFCDIVDLNAGCPVRKVVTTGAGAALLENPDWLYRILKEMSQVIEIPVTVKIRIPPENIDFIEFIEQISSSGVDAITIHGRVREQMYSGRADWEKIAVAVEHSCVPVIGNGDVVDYTTAKQMMDVTGCEAVMIGRAAIGNPLIFRHLVSEGRVLNPKGIPAREKIHALLGYTDLARKFGIPEKIQVLHAIKFTRDLPRSARLRARLTGIKKIEEAINIILRYYDLPILQNTEIS
ncbi:MAG: tRNA dihydrouridine synthase DusB [Candidatus Hecatellales archaeon]|nr:MAG: tRNA dihydrouridine synthase DusB [Candidatus Hecatellales archaeon]